MELLAQPPLHSSITAEKTPFDSPLLQTTEQPRDKLARKPLERTRSASGVNSKNAATNLRATGAQQLRQIQLPFWPDEVRGVPNAALRGALFTVSQTRAVATKRQLVATVNGLEVRFKGERLNQHDLDLWEMLLHFARTTMLGNRAEFSANKLLKALRRGIGGSDHDKLKEDIARLIGGVVEITWLETGQTFIGSLVEKAFRDEGTQRYVVILDEKILGLFDTGYTQVDWRVRQRLAGNSLAKWLHGFYSTHASPIPYKVATIKALCGSNVERLVDFRKALRVALNKLVSVKGLTSWEITKETDLLKVRRTPSSSQKRHIQRKQEMANSAEFQASATT